MGEQFYFVDLAILLLRRSNDFSILYLLEISQSFFSSLCNLKSIRVFMPEPCVGPCLKLLFYETDFNWHKNISLFL